LIAGGLGRYKLRSLCVLAAILLNHSLVGLQCYGDGISIGKSFQLACLIGLYLNALRVLQCRICTDGVIYLQRIGLLGIQRVCEGNDSLCAIPAGIAVYAVLRLISKELRVLQNLMILFCPCKSVCGHLPLGVIHDGRGVVKLPESGTAHRVCEQELTEYLCGCLAVIGYAVNRVVVVDILQRELNLVLPVQLIVYLVTVVNLLLMTLAASQLSGIAGILYPDGVHPLQQPGA